MAGASIVHGEGLDVAMLPGAAGTAEVASEADVEAQDIPESDSPPVSVSAELSITEEAQGDSTCGGVPFLGFFLMLSHLCGSSGLSGAIGFRHETLLLHHVQIT